jgi:hypothetical protein
MQRVESVWPRPFGVGGCRVIRGHLAWPLWLPSARGRNGVAFSCVSLLSNPQRVQRRLERAPIDYLRGSKFSFREPVFPRSSAARFVITSLPRVAPSTACTPVNARQV